MKFNRMVKRIRLGSRATAGVPLWLLVTLVYPVPAGVALAQPVSVGVRGGIELIRWFKELNTGPTSVATDKSSKGVVGPFVSIKLPGRLALQVEGLRRGYGFERSGSGLGVFNSHSESGSSWEIPALVMWRPPYQESGWQPYAGAGPAFRYVRADWVETLTRPQIRPSDPPSSNTQTPGHRSAGTGGFVATAGMERQYGPVVVSIDLRYGFWAASTLTVIDAIHPNRNQVSVLFGLRSR